MSEPSQHTITRDEPAGAGGRAARLADPGRLNRARYTVEVVRRAQRRRPRSSLDVAGARCLPTAVGVARRAEHTRAVARIDAIRGGRGSVVTAARTVLVVDDDQGIRSMLALVLEDEGFRVATAANGAEALARIRAEPFVGILLDMMMPVMDGATFLAAWASEAPHRRAPVVVMSANRAAGEALSLGAVDFVAKPFDIDQLVGVVARAFRAGEPSPVSPAGAAR